MFLARKEESYKFMEGDNWFWNTWRYYVGIKGLTQSMKTTYDGGSFD